jgi:hypothetical protein
MRIDCIMSNMKRKRVTLCPTTAVKCYVSNGIPEGLEKILFCLSDRIPVCIISSKDFTYLHNRVRFAEVLSCVLGTETVIHNPHYGDYEIDNFGCIGYQYLITSSHLMDSSKLLHNIVESLQNQNHKDITIEEKYDSAKEILIGLTIDYRHLDNWQLFKENKEPSIRELIQRTINANLRSNLSSKYRPFIQTYSSHPFLDVYGVECNKGLAFDNVLSHLKQEERGGNVMYLGDSENDNPAFRRSDISIGILSNARLNPKLDCKYMLNFNRLPLFLRGLIDNDFLFSEDLTCSC